jgi:UDP-hydrolysing UDP-N-acetyl-D-glucosamine 2-epimerase
MGEDPDSVHLVGCPSIDLVARVDRGSQIGTLSRFGGAGSPIDPEAPYVLVMQHPVTTEYGHGIEQMDTTLEAVRASGLQALVFWPNVDAGSEHLAKSIRLFREQGRDDRFHFFRNLPPEEFIRVMAHAACMVGNSSAALREGAYLGVPAVNVGTRQHDRERAENVVDADHDVTSIGEAIRRQVAHGPYASSALFGDGTAGVQIAEVLAAARPTVQKRLRLDLAAAQVQAGS